MRPCESVSLNKNEEKNLLCKWKRNKFKDIDFHKTFARQIFVLNSCLHKIKKTCTDIINETIDFSLANVRYNYNKANK